MFSDLGGAGQTGVDAIDEDYEQDAGGGGGGGVSGGGGGGGGHNGSGLTRYV